MTQQFQVPKGSLISFMSNKVKQYGGINFAQGIPGIEPPLELPQYLSEVASENVHQYAPGIGNLLLREQILLHYDHLNYHESQLLITQGATEALSLVMQYLKFMINENFGVMAFDPVYESYKHLPRIFKLPFHAYQNANFDKIELEKFVQSNNIKVIFVSSPGNPFGYVFSEQQMDDLREVCEHNDAYLIIDAVYRELWYENKVYLPEKELSSNVFYVNSFSKMLSITGWRIGYLFCHKKHSEVLRDIHDYIGLCVNAPLQEALARYLKNESFGKLYVNETRNHLKSFYGQMSKELIKVGFQVPQANGGYYVWAKLPYSIDGFQFAMNLYEEEGVAVIPGMHFSDMANDYLRFNIARPESEIAEGIEKVVKFSRQYFR
jgi:aspartate/methionine/tyrosine aminotransferase